MINLNIKLLTKSAKAMQRAYPNDAGADLYADETVIIPEFGRGIVRTGVAVQIEPGSYGKLHPRSGLAAKGISVDGGLIDPGYTGEIMAIMRNNTPHRYTINAGDKITQLVIAPCHLPTINIVDEFSEATERGACGFGSSGQ